MSDLIERQAAIDALNQKKIYRPLDSDRYVISDCLNTIVKLPSAEPVRMKGRWIPKEDRAKQEIFICSECGGWAYSPWIGSRKTPKPNWCKYAYCPHCGTEMSKGDE